MVTLRGGVAVCEDGLFSMSTDANDINGLCARGDESETGPGSGEQPAGFWFSIEGALWKYVVRMWLLAFVPSILIALALSATGVLDNQSGPDFGSGRMPAIAVFIGVVVISPIVETLLMGVVFKLLSFVTRRRYALAVMSCIFWAGLHSVASPPWGLTIFWPFFVFSCCYLAWRRVSWWRAVWMTTLVHMLQNLLPGLVVLFSARPGVG